MTMLTAHEVEPPLPGDICEVDGKPAVVRLAGSPTCEGHAHLEFPAWESCLEVAEVASSYDPIAVLIRTGNYVPSTGGP